MATFVGKLTAGLGRGAHFVSLPYYQDHFLRVLDYSPFPGTLNLKVEGGLDPEQLRAAGEAREIPAGESERGKHGGVTCYRAMITYNGHSEEVGLLVPHLSSHSDTVEAVSRRNLRDRLHLSDGDPITVELLS